MTTNYDATTAIQPNGDVGRNVVTFAELIKPQPVQVALWCASLGWRVLPVRYSPSLKKPALKKWPELATIDPRVITDWWDVNGDFPGCQVGIATGRESGIWVLDIDAKKANGFATLLDRYSVRDRPQTFIVRTPSAGEHWYFAYPPNGREISTRAHKLGSRYGLGPGLDTRGHHGYVMAPHQNQLGYDVIRNVWPTPAPRWLENLAERRAYEPTAAAWTPPEAVNGAWGQAALEATAAKLAVQPSPGRNQALFDAALALGALAAYGVLAREDTWLALRAACAANGLLDEDGERQCAATFDSGWNAGLAREMGYR
jgi:Bifunctional DNA primase/polymerase, N-terminal